MSTIGTNRPELIEPAARLQARSDPQAVAAWLREVFTTDLRPNLGRITIPLLEIMPYDPSDATRPPAYTQEQTLAFYKLLLATAPKASVLAITPARHFVMLDQPEQFYKAVSEFLASVHN
jgi:pimeloyl-ACP methyl ester carboxylesterase